MKSSISERSPLSPTRWPREAFSWPRTLAAFVLVTLSFGVGLAVDSWIAVHSGVTRSDIVDQHLTWGILIGQLANYVPVVLALLWVLPRLGYRSLAELGVRAPDGEAIRTGVIGALVMYAVTIGLASLQYVITQHRPTEPALSLFASAHDPLLALAFGALAIAIAPFVEELAFRGFLFNAALRYAPTWLAATLSGALFGLSHGSPSAFLPLAGSGIVLAYVYYRSGSLAASIITHALFNAVNVAQLAIGLGT